MLQSLPMTLMPWFVYSWSVLVCMEGIFRQAHRSSWNPALLIKCPHDGKMFLWRLQNFTVSRVPLVLFSWRCADLFKCNNAKHTRYIWTCPCASVHGFTGQKRSQSIVWMWEMGDAVRSTSGTWHSLARSHTFLSTNLFYRQLPRDWLSVYERGRQGGNIVPPHCQRWWKSSCAQ